MPRTLRYILVWMLSSLVYIPVAAQERYQLNPDDRAAAQRSVEDARRVEQARQAEAASWASAHGVPLRVEQPDGRAVQLVGVDAARPVYLTQHNQEAAHATGTDVLYPGGVLGLSLTGEGLEIGHWDAGHPLAEHQELFGRVSAIDVAGDDDHATHVAGTLIASGVRADAQGMAYRATLRAYDWTNDATEMTNEGARGLLVSNHSYGAIAGWHFGDVESIGAGWYWFGDPTIDDAEDYAFGWYSTETAQFDRATFAHPYFLPVVAAGNDREDRGPRLGTYRALDEVGRWKTYDVATRPIAADGRDDGYDTIAGAALAKNVLTVGSINLNGAGASPIQLSPFSSMGPTDDGRIKPDLVGFGEHVLSSTTGDTDRYARFSGTSMATPNVAGTLLLLQQHYHNLSGTYMRAATLKALAVHTATDAGPQGPDYQYGWGLLNAAAATRQISESVENPLAVLEEELREAPFMQPATMDAPGPLRVTLCWTDRPGTPARSNGPAALDDPKPQLQRDLDLRVVNVATGAAFLPYTLDVARPAAPAVPGDNVVDPIEQVYLPEAPAGAYTIVVTAKGAYQGPQSFSLVVGGAQGTLRSVAVGHLEAEVDVDAVMLTWQTLFERGAGAFKIERAPVRYVADQRNIGLFEAIADVAGHGPSDSTTAYAYRDDPVLAGRYVYRFTYEANGQRDVTGALEVNVPAPSQLALVSSYPNPFSDQANVVLDFPKAQEAHIAIFDVLGRRMLTLHDGPLAAGRHRLPVDATGWAPGIYVVRVESPSGVRTHRMVLAR